MEKIRTLLTFLTRHKIKAQSIVPPNENGSNSKLSQLIDLATNQKNYDERNISLMLYSKEKDGRFAKLKFDLKQKLLSSLLLIDFKKNNYNKFNTTYCNCYRDWLICHFMIRLGLRKIGIAELKKVMQKAKLCGLTTIELEGQRYICSHHSGMWGNYKKLQEASKKLEDIQQKYIAEIKAETYYNELKGYYIKDKSTKEFVYPLCQTYLENLAPYQEQENSINFHFYYHTITAMQVMSINDYPATIEVCKKALQYFENLSLVPNSYLRTFYYQMIVGFTVLRQYKEGKVFVKKCLKLVKHTHNSWFKVHELHLILSLHSKEYQAAWEIYEEVTKHKKFSTLPAYTKEVWSIYRAYLWILIVNQKITLPTTQQALFQPLKLTKFLNDLPQTTKDKAGYNIPIRIVEMISLLHQKKHLELYDKIESLRKYSSRYLSKENTFRSFYFVQMIMTMAKCGFHKSETVEKTTKLLIELDTVPLDLANQAFELEVLPYTHIWGIIMEYLEDCRY